MTAGPQAVQTPEQLLEQIVGDYPDWKFIQSGGRWWATRAVLAREALTPDGQATISAPTIPLLRDALQTANRRAPHQNAVGQDAL